MSRKNEVYAYIKLHIDQNGMPPTLRETAIAIGLSYPGVQQKLQELVRDGKLRLIPGKSRGIVVVGVSEVVLLRSENERLKKQVILLTARLKERSK